MRQVILLAILTAAALAGCVNTPEPKLAKGLRGSTTLQPYPEWDQRVRQRFPIGSDESSLLTELHHDNFVLDPRGPGRANYTQYGFPCRQDWGVKWTAQDGHITEIAGEHSASCL